MSICLLERNWTIALPFHQIPGCTGASVEQGEIGRSRSSRSGPCSFEGLVFGSNFSQPHLTAEEYWNQLSGSVRRAGQSFLQITRKRLERPRTQLLLCKVCVRPEMLWFMNQWILWLSKASVVRVSPHHTYQHCLSFGEFFLHFGLHFKKKVLCTHTSRYKTIQGGNHHIFRQHKVNFSEMWGLAYRLSGRPVGPKKRVYFQMAASNFGCSRVV